MSDEDDRQLFRKLYGNIERVGHDRNEPWKEPPAPRPRKKHRDEADLPPAHEPLLLHPMVDDTDTHGDYQYRANGIQNNVFQKLRRGRLPVEAILDLHGMTREIALQALVPFIEDCRRQGHRCIQVIHGKGYRSESGKPVLKPSVARWLRQMESVLAYCPALPRDGGDGALYVLLKSRR